MTEYRCIMVKLFSEADLTGLLNDMAAARWEPFMTDGEVLYCRRDKVAPAKVVKKWTSS